MTNTDRWIAGLLLLVLCVAVVYVGDWWSRKRER